MSEQSQLFSVIGLMSGTSLDGVDVALIKTDGLNHIEPVAFFSRLYSNERRDQIRQCFGRRNDLDGTVAKAALDLTEDHIHAIAQMLARADLDPSDIHLYGFHGQTISHDPNSRFTWQIGRPDLIADYFMAPVIFDFRAADVAAGGQGAPLLPLYHEARVRQHGLETPVVILNLGGVGNITWIGPKEGDVIACDTGPANAMIDDFVNERTNQSFDKDGALAAKGVVNVELLEQWMSDPFFAAVPPKSLDRNAFKCGGVQELSTEDGAATLTAFTIASVLRALEHMPQAPKALYVAGGGRLNKTIMDGLSAALKDCKVGTVDDLGWNGDAVEAEGFAYLALRAARGLPLSLPTTTGVPSPMKGGKVVYPEVPEPANGNSGCCGGGCGCH